LGIKDIVSFNVALLAKWKWITVIDNQGLWLDVLQSKYGSWRRLDELERIREKLIWWMWERSTRKLV